MITDKFAVTYLMAMLNTEKERGKDASQTRIEVLERAVAAIEREQKVKTAIKRIEKLCGWRR